jgi:hypothetical protein
MFDSIDPCTSDGVINAVYFFRQPNTTTSEKKIDFEDLIVWQIVAVALHIGPFRRKDNLITVDPLHSRIWRSSSVLSCVKILDHTGYPRERLLGSFGD